MPDNIKNSAILIAVLSLLFAGCNKSSPTGNTTTPTWQTVFSDDFNRADGPIGANYDSTMMYLNLGPDGHTPTQLADPPSRLVGVLSISNNRVRLTGWTIYAIRYVTGVANEVVKISVKCVPPTALSDSFSVGIVARWKNLSPNPDWGQESYTGGIGDSGIGILKISGLASPSSMPPPLISQYYSLKKGGSYLLELTINKKNLTFVVTDLATNVAQTLNVTDTGATLAGKIVGIGGWQKGGDTTYFDDFKIEKYE